MDSTTERTSEETNLSLVWLENLGSGNLTEIIQVKPSLASSPAILILYFAHGVPLSNTPLTFVIKRRLETLACDEVLKTCKWAIKRD